jgi:hypothetical protein
MTNDDVQPFPAALRFLGAHELIEEADTFARVILLTSSRESRDRVEGGRTVVSLIRNGHRFAWLYSMSILLSFDRSQVVVAHAGRAVALLALDTRTPLSSVIHGRLLDLLNADGVQVPGAVLRGLSEVGMIPSDVQRAAIETLSSRHPSEIVRHQARRCLQEVRQREGLGTDDLGISTTNPEEPTAPA